QVAAPAQLAGAQHLRGVALPGVLVAVKAREAPHQKDGQADVGIDVKQEVVQCKGHGGLLGVQRAAPAGGWRRVMWMGWALPGAAWPWLLQPPKAAGSSQLASSGSSAGSGAAGVS